MIEILTYKSVNKNTLQGVFNIKIAKWGNFIIRDVSYFKKNDQRWISFPSKQYEKDGEKKYYSYNLFEDQGIQKNFTEKVLQALDDYFVKESQKPLVNHTPVDVEIPF